MKDFFNTISPLRESFNICFLHFAIEYIEKIMTYFTWKINIPELISKMWFYSIIVTASSHVKCCGFMLGCIMIVQSMLI